jgi:hypothetical protein
LFVTSVPINIGSGAAFHFFSFAVDGERWRAAGYDNKLFA